MRRNYSNTAVATTLAAGITDSDTTLTVADATGYPDPPFTITIGSEVILVGAKDGTTFSSLTRGYDGTVAAAHDSGAGVEHTVVAEDMVFSRVPPFSSMKPLPGNANSTLYTVGFSMGTSTINTLNDSVYLTPINIGETVTIKGIGVEITTAGSEDGVARLALFERQEGGFISADPIVSPSIISATTIGTKETLITPVTLRPGIYLIGLEISGFTTPPVVRGHGGNDVGVLTYVHSINYGRTGIVCTGNFESELSGQVKNTPIAYLRLN